MAHYLVTTTGAVRLSDSALIARDSGIVLASDLRDEYLTRNLGWVSVRLRQGRALIQLRPALVSPLAVAASLRLLDRQSWAQAAICRYDGSTWIDEIVGGAIDGVRERVLGLLNEVRRQRACKLLSRVDGLHQLNSSSPLAALLHMWVNSHYELDAEKAGRILRKHSELRCVIVEASPGLETLSFKDIVGDRFLGLDEHWRAMAHGMRIQDQPDYEFGCWIERTYREVALSMQARLDAVDTEVKRPHRGLVRSRYRRLVLPFGSASSNMMILSATVLDRSIDLRSETHQ